MILVRGPWYETPGSPDLPFTLNRRMSFPSVFVFWELFIVVCLPYVFFLINAFAGKIRRGRLVNWVEKDGFKKIQKLLEISERERHHKILLTVKNLYELNRNPFPYTLPVIPRPLPAEVVEGEHYVIANLWTLFPGSSSPAQT